MSIGTADLAKAINTTWDASTLNASFLALRRADVADAEFPVLHEQEAGGEQPFPYCIFEIPEGTTTTRMSKGVNDNWETRDVPLFFRVHTAEVVGDARTAKEIAAFLIEETMKVFGGHPTQVPTGTITLDNGNHLVTTYQNDFSVREGEDNYVWTLSYSIRLDIPVMHTAV
jgi:hypothetical protein